MSVRSKPYTVQEPLDLEALDEMLDILFQDTRNGNLEIDVSQITTGVLPVTSGGTGLPSVVQGDLLYGSAADTLARLAKDTNTTRYLSNTGTSNNPAWAQVALSTGVSGDLPFANLTQGSALSVLGVTGNATADHASIAAGTDHQVLRRSGTALAFGAVDLSQAAAITGDLPDANLSANVPLLNAANTFTATGNNFDEILAVDKGLQFPATQVASAGANVLDDYEEGDWTPGVSFGGGTTGITYTAQAGRYTKIGRMVYCLGVVELSSKGSSTGSALITGAPFANSSTAGGTGSSKVSYSAFTAGVQEFGLQTQGSATSFLPVKSVTGTNTVLTDADFTNTSVFVMYICYSVD